jgi:hypothetical protein
MKVKLTARLAFANIFEAKSVAGEGEPRYSAAFIIDPKSPDVKAIKAAIDAVAKEKWKDKAPGVLAELAKKDRIAYRESPRCNESGEPYAGFEGKFSLNASNKARPTIIDRDKTPLTQADGKPYSGCTVVASVEFWAQDNQWGRRINATLRGVQFHSDGDSFGGGAPASTEEFDDLSAGADDVA